MLMLLTALVGMLLATPEGAVLMNPPGPFSTPAVPDPADPLDIAGRPDPTAPSGLLGMSGLSGFLSSTLWRALLFGNLGIALVAAAGAVVNQLIDRHIDAQMKRTHNRPLPQGG